MPDDAAKIAEIQERLKSLGVTPLTPAAQQNVVAAMSDKPAPAAPQASSPEGASASARIPSGNQKIDEIWNRLDSRPKPQEQPGKLEALWEGLKKGVVETGQGVAQLATRLPDIARPRMMPRADLPGAQPQPKPLQAGIDQSIAQSGQAYAQNPARMAHPMMAGAGRIGGNIAATAPLAMMPGAAAGGMGARLGLGAAMGAGGAATQPAPPSGDYWPDKLKQLAIGGAGGAVMGGAGGMIGPALSPALQKIQQTFPHLARMATGAEGRDADSFQRAMANQVLEPIGGSIPRNTKPGDTLIDAVDDKLDDAFNAVKPHLMFDGADPKFTTGLKSLVQGSNIMSPAKATQFAKFLETYVTKPLSQGVSVPTGGAPHQISNVLDGEAFKKAESQIGASARQFVGPRADPDQQMLGEHLRQLQQLMRDTLIDQNPHYGPQLQRINAAWRRFVTMDTAAERNPDARRTFQPHDVIMSLGSSASRRRQLSKDDELMRRFAEAGDDMMRGRPINQQKMQRFIGDLLGGTIGGAAGAGIGSTFGPMGAGIGAAAGGAAGAGLAEAARGAIGRQIQKPAARAIGSAISRGAPEAGVESERISTIGP
jgi:hypothetical protein